MLSILSELSSCCVCWFILSPPFPSSKKTAKGQTEGENAKVFLFLFLELEDAIISKVDNHNDSVRRHSHTGRAIHLSKATPLCAEFA